MTLLAYVGGVDRAYRVRLGAMGLSTRADGSTAIGGIEFDDPDGTLTIRGWQQLIVVEDDCLAAPILASGFVGPRRYQRGGQFGSYRGGPGRYIDTDMVDQNSVTSIRLITNPDGSRPAESHNARINWLLGSTYLSGLIIDDGRVDASHPRPLDKADYRGQKPQDVLLDIAAPINKAFFAYIIQTGGVYGLQFANPTTQYAVSSLAISNDPDDITFTGSPAFETITGDTYLPMIDAVLTRDPSEIVSLVRYVYAHGLVLEGRPLTYTEFFSAAATGGLDLGNRGMNVENTRIGSEESARIMAQGILEKRATEQDVIVTTVRVPKTKVGLLDIGMTVLAKFTHLANEGYGSFVPLQCLSRTVLQPRLGNKGIDDRFYDLVVELSNTRGVQPGGGGGGAPGPGDFPAPPPQPPTIVQSKFDEIDLSGGITLDNPPSAGNWLIIGISSRGTSIVLPSGWTEHPHGQITPGGDFGRMAYRQVGVGETALVHVSDGGGRWTEVWEVSGIDGTLDASSFADVDTGTQPLNINGGTLTPTAGLPMAMFLLLVQHNSDWGGNGPTTMSTPAGWTTDGEYEVTNSGDLHPNVQADSQIVNPASGSYGTASVIGGAGFNYAGWGGLAMAFGSSAAVNPPTPSQWVYNEQPTFDADGPLYTGQLLHPYVGDSNGNTSLTLKVNKLDQTAAIIAWDPDCGTFQLAFDPWSKGWLIEATYQAQAG
jgi:hypothetical protein